MSFTPKKLPYKEFKNIYSKVPRLCIDLIIQSDEGIVLSERSIEPGKGLWHLPGGTLLFGETITEAIQRIAMEETGFKVKIEKQMGVMEFAKPDNLFLHAVGIAFLVTPVEGKLRGSHQGEKIAFHKRLPTPIIEEQATFLVENGLS